MELVPNPVAQQAFDNIFGAYKTPLRHFSDFEKFVRSSADEFFSYCGIQRVEYGVALPPNILVPENAPKNTVLYETDAGNSKVKETFVYPMLGGEAHFNVYLLYKLSDEELKKLEIVTRQIFYILKSLTIELSYNKLMLTDYKMGITNVEGFLNFAATIISQKRISYYTALYFNIHNFKSIHKELSYSEGNEALAEYCAIVSNAVSRNEIVSRLGSDTFLALVLDENRGYFIDLIQNMVVSYKSRNGMVYSFKFGATIGASILTDVVDDPGEIMMQTSTAYQYAREQREILGYYDPALREEIFARRSVLSKFSEALHNGEFFAVYQPKVSANTHEIIGAEALVRWRQPDGCTMPNSFISILEADGCITSLDFFVLEQVCRLLSELIKENIEPVKVSVNFSKRHLANNKLVEEIVEVIDRYNVPHKYIEVELTEGEDFHNNEVMRSVVDDLRNLGIKTSIDDFGTGYSSLAMLRTLAIDVLKIDRSFIPKPPIEVNCRSYLTLQGVVTLAKSLGLTIVAEGVETKEQLEVIENMGCDMIQGYIFDKPLSEEEFVERIKRKVYTLKD